MGLGSWIKSLLHRSEPEDMMENQVEEEEEQGPVLPAFNRGMPIDIMSDFETVLFSGRLGTLDKDELTIDRIPGEMSFPQQQVGTEVVVRGYDLRMNPIILWATVVRSSAIECALGEWREDVYMNQRKSIRYPVTPSAEIYTMDDVRLNRPQPCQLVNISIGGACFLSEYVYEMGQMLRLRVEMIEKGGHTSYQSQVVRVVPRDDGRFEYGLLFAQLDKKKINTLMRDIQDIQKNTEKRLLS